MAEPTDESQDMVNTPFGFGDGVDVLTEEAENGVLAHYPILILTGDIDLTGEFIARVRSYLATGGTVILDSNLIALQANLAGSPGTVLTAADPNSMVSAIRQAYQPLAPFSISGNVSYQINRSPDGAWIAAIFNHQGVTKAMSGNAPETVNHALDQVVTLSVPGDKPVFSEVWKGGSVSNVSAGALTVLVPAGSVVVLKLVITSR